VMQALPLVLATNVPSTRRAIAASSLFGVGSNVRSVDWLSVSRFG